MKNRVIDIDLRVSTLLNPESGDWDLGTLNDLFYPSDVKLILKIKVAVGEEDFKVWKHNKSGAYSTKSGYWMGYNLSSSQAKMEAEALPSLNPLKERIWFLKIPPKLKVFLWKCLSLALPVAEGLASRGMKVDMRCQFCGDEPESANHIFFTCHVARRVWAEAEFPARENGFHESSIYLNMDFLMKKAKESDRYKVYPWILWRLWKNRNTYIFEGKIFETRDIVSKAVADCDEWLMAQTLSKDVETHGELIDNSRVLEWEPPEVGWVRCDIGIEWCKHTLVSGASWILRDDRGEVLLHSRCSFANVTDAIDAHSNGWLWAIESMGSLGRNKIIFGVESGEIVGAILRPPAWPSFKGVALKIKSSLHFLDRWKLLLVKRKAILPAYLIAKSAVAENFAQSYVARGYPRWLSSFFV